MAQAELKEVAEEQNGIDELEAGFDGAPTTEEALTPVEEVSPGSVPVEYARITKTQWDELLAKSTEIEQIRADNRKGIDTALGKYGELARTLGQLQSATPSGYTVDVTDDIVEDLKAEFPELGNLQLKAFKKFASKLSGTASATSQAFDPAQMEQQVSDAVASRLIVMQTEALEDDYADWRTIVGTQADKDNAYRKWLGTQSAEYQTKLGSTNNAAVISHSIARFQKDTVSRVATRPAAPARPSTRQAQLEAAVSPRGTGAHAPSPTGDDDFTAGFNSG